MRPKTILFLLACLWISPVTAQRILSMEKPVPLFVPQQGQWQSPEVARLVLPEVAVYLEKQSIAFVFSVPESIEPLGEDQQPRRYAIRQHFLGASPEAIPELSDRESGSFQNFYLGRESDWRSKVPVGSSFWIRQLYPGVDVHFQVHQGSLKSTYHCAHGAAAKQIQTRWEGLDKVELADNGDILLHVLGSIARETAPVASQPVRWAQDKEGCFSLAGPALRSTDSVLIDPYYVFSTFSGGTSDNFGYTATYDAHGRTWSGGVVFGAGYPHNNGFQTTYASGGCDMALTLWNKSGTGYRSSTFLGGNNREAPHSLVTAPNGDLVIFGTSGSNNFPHLSNAYDTTFGGGTPVNGDGVYFNNGTDLVVVRLDSTGSQWVGGTYIGGSGNDGMSTAPNANPLNYGDVGRGEVITNDRVSPGLPAAGAVFVATCTRSADFPVKQPLLPTGTPADTLPPVSTLNAVVLRLSPDLSSLEWSIVFGGTDADMAYGLSEANTGSTDFTHVMAVGTTFNAGIARGNDVIQPTPLGALPDGFGSLIHAVTGAREKTSYLGSMGSDRVYSVATDAQGMNQAVGTSQANVIMGHSLGAGSMPLDSGLWGQAGSSQFLWIIGSQLDTVYRQMVFGKGQRILQDVSPTALAMDHCGNSYFSGWGGLVNTNGSTTGLVTTPNAMDSTTDGSDFYFLVLAPDGKSAKYASFFGGGSLEHVDGGTSRFSPEGIIHQAVCAGCGGNSSFPTFPANAHSTVNASSNCNIAAVQIAFETSRAEIHASLLPLSGCAPHSVSFTGFVSNAQSISVFWGDAQSQTVTSLGGLTHLYTNPGTYTVRVVAVDTLCQTSDTALFTVVVSALLPGVGFPLATWDPCDTLRILSVDYPAGAPVGNRLFTLQWGDGSVHTFYGAWSNALTHGYSSPGVFSVRWKALDSVCGVVDSTAWNISFVPDFLMGVPTLEIDACAQPPVVRARGAAQGAQVYRWYPFGVTGPVLTGPQVQWTVPTQGNYTVWWVAEDTLCHRVDTSFLSVNVIPVDTSAIKLPNVFTPDGNGVNDCFSLPSAGQNGLMSWSLIVYDRWGEKVFQTSDPAFCWEGTFRDRPLAEGVYFYSGSWADACGGGGTLHRSVTILRSP